MKANMGVLDRSIRVILVVVIAALYFGGKISGALATVLGILALIFLVTSLVSYCPLYSPLGISTCKKRQAS